MKEDAEKILQEAGLDPNDKKALQEKREELEKIPENQRTEEQNRLLKALQEQNAATLAIETYEKEQAALKEQLSLMERMKRDEKFRQEIEDEAKRTGQSVNDVLLQRARDRVKDNANAMEHAATTEQKNDIAADTTKTTGEALKIASDPQLGDLRSANTDEQAVGASEHAKIAQSSKIAALTEAAFDDDAAPAAVAQAPAAPRMTINALPLAAAGLDKLGAAPELAANDTAPERKPEAPKVAQISSPGAMGV